MTGNTVFSNFLVPLKYAGSGDFEV